jgi:hypothetical protein
MMGIRMRWENNTANGGCESAYLALAELLS